MKNFRPHEFQCACIHDCGLGFAHIDQDFLERLEMARIYADVKFKLNSAVRCEKHNQDVGGSEGSAHMRGLAVDIATPNSHMRQRITYGLVKAGFHRMGVYKNFVHVDEDPTKAPQVMWFSD